MSTFTERVAPVVDATIAALSQIDQALTQSKIRRPQLDRFHPEHFELRRHRRHRSFLQSGDVGF
jgi:hypothetical protein